MVPVSLSLSQGRQHKYSWQVSHELVLVYMEDEDNSTTMTLGSVFESGGQDSRLARAKTSAEMHFKGIFRPLTSTVDQSKQSGKKWNGKDTPDAKGICVTYNVGGEHPAKHLHPDGTCKFRHVCNAWVTGKGPDGCCEGAHPRKSCTNPDRSATEKRQ